jgi:hypothetical protein
VLLDQKVHDTMLASRVARAGEWVRNKGKVIQKSHGLDECLQRELDIEIPKDTKLKWGGLLHKEHLEYATDDVAHLKELHEALLEVLREHGVQERYEAISSRLLDFIGGSRPTGQSTNGRPGAPRGGVVWSPPIRTTSPSTPKGSTDRSSPPPETSSTSPSRSWQRIGAPRPTFCSRCTTKWSWNALRRKPEEPHCGSRRKMGEAMEEILGGELGGPTSAEVGYDPSWDECMELEVKMVVWFWTLLLLRLQRFAV